LVWITKSHPAILKQRINSYLKYFIITSSGRSINIVQGVTIGSKLHALQKGAAVYCSVTSEVQGSIPGRTSASCERTVGVTVLDRRRLLG
jgi:hypothetical protein